MYSDKSLISYTAAATIVHLTSHPRHRSAKG
jgi:hypothetical protein